MRYIFLVFSYFLLIFNGCQSANNDGNIGKPNILIIFTDDQGSIDLNIYGSKDLVTPHMDAIAEDGIRFTQFYAGSSVCSPSRACLMTGRYPHFAGLAGNAGSHHGAIGMPSEQITMAEVFKEAGYKTGHIGKWHLGFSDGTTPNDQGFDYSFGHMGGCIDNYSHFFYWVPPNQHDLWRNGEEVWHDGEYFPDLMVDEVNRFMERNQNDPFFLFWAINVPHYPLQATEKWRKQYADLDHPRDKYAALISTMDEKIGAVLEQLEALGLKDNTIVVFQSDHGHSMEKRTFGGGGNSGPYRGAKFSLFEGGIRVPAIIAWPGKLPTGEVREQIVTGADWFPTLIDLAGLPQPKHKINGKSIVPVINSEDSTSPHDMFHWQFGKQWAVRKNNWKLIGNPVDPSNKTKLSASDSLFLVNLNVDIRELNNIAINHPEKVEELKEIHSAWLNEYASED